MTVGSLLDDNAWHDVEVIRRDRNVSLLVDRVRVDDIIYGDFKRLDLNKKVNRKLCFVLFFTGIIHSSYTLVAFQHLNCLG